MTVDAGKISEILAGCAEKYILPRFRILKDHEISTKSGPRDLVTHADLDVEAHLARVLPDLLPGSVVIGEEGISKGEMSAAILNDADAKVWVVDPVDGTYNFVQGSEQFGILLAFVVGGETRRGWIYDVPKRKMIVAEKGAGAWEEGRRLQVRHASRIEDMVVHVNSGFFPKGLRKGVEAALKRFKSHHTLRCAAHEYMRILRGTADASLYARMKPWDHLAGALAVQEAGGHVAKWDGTPYEPRDEGRGLIVTTDRKNWEIIRELLAEHVRLDGH